MVCYHIRIRNAQHASRLFCASSTYRREGTVFNDMGSLIVYCM